MLYYLIYFSRAVNLLNIDQLNQLLDQSRAWNTQHHITGMLIYLEGRFLADIEGRFMQVLEGTEEEVEFLFKKIQKDSRHHQILILNRGRLEKRNFADWQMGYEKVDLLANQKIEGFFTLDDTFMQNHDKSSANMALAFLKSFYHSNKKLQSR